MPHRFRQLARVACAIALITPVAAVCNPPLDTEGLEPQLLRQVEEKTRQDFVSVSCPRDVQPETGHTFECTAVDPDDVEFTILVTQLDDQGYVNWEFVNAAPGGA